MGNEEIIDRLMRVLRVNSDSELSRTLGVHRSTVGSWRNRGNIPLKECIDLALAQGISLDWLILGREPMHVAGASAAKGVDEDDEMSMAAIEATEDWEKRAHLGDLALLARTGRRAGPWAILCTLSRKAEPMRMAQIVEGLGQEIGGKIDVAADVALLRHLGLVATKGDLVALVKEGAVLRSSDVGDVAEHVQQAIDELLTDIVPAATAPTRRGYLVTSTLCVGAGRGREVVEALRRGAKEQWENEVRADGVEEVTIVLGVAFSPNLTPAENEEESR